LLEKKVLLFLLFLCSFVFSINLFYLNYQTPSKLSRNRDHQEIKLHFSNIVFESAKHLFWPQVFLITVLSYFIILLAILQTVLATLVFLSFHFILFIFAFSCIIQTELFAIFIFLSPSSSIFLTLNFHHRHKAKVLLLIFWYLNHFHVSFLLSMPRTIISYYWAVLYLKTLL